MSRVSSPSLGHRVAALLLLILVAGAFYVGVIDQLWMGRHRLYQTNMEQLVDRLHHLERLATARPKLEEAIQTIRNDQRTSAYFLPQAAPPLAAADLQQRVKSLIEGSGGNLLSVQSLPAVEEGNVVRVAVSVTLQGGVDTLQKTLYGLESQSPLLFVDDLQVTARRFRPRLPDGKIAPYTRTQLNAQFEVAGYLRKEGG
ncbi:MAG: type II secretion system protein M [Candidatus Competibacteraceae bacterium]|nr:type II secretion system protein M [Candidatus Competibacteraceae bacterium]